MIQKRMPVRVILAVLLAVACLFPAVASAQRGRRQSSPVLMTAQGPVRKTVAYPYLYQTKDAYDKQRKLEDDWFSKMQKQQTGNTKPSAPKTNTPPKKK